MTIRELIAKRDRLIGELANVDAQISEADRVLSGVNDAMIHRLEGEVVSGRKHKRPHWSKNPPTDPKERKAWDKKVAAWKKQMAENARGNKHAKGNRWSKK